MTIEHRVHATASSAFEELLVQRHARPSLFAMIKRWLGLR